MDTRNYLQRLMMMEILLSISNILKKKDEVISGYLIIFISTLTTSPI